MNLNSGSHTGRIERKARTERQLGESRLLKKIHKGSGGSVII